MVDQVGLALADRKDGVVERSGGLLVHGLHPQNQEPRTTCIRGSGYLPWWPVISRRGPLRGCRARCRLQRETVPTHGLVRIREQPRHSYWVSSKPPQSESHWRYQTSGLPKPAALEVGVLRRGGLPVGASTRSRAEGDSRSATDKVREDESRSSRHRARGNPGGRVGVSDRRASGVSVRPRETPASPRTISTRSSI